MLNAISGALAAVAGGFSGSDSKCCIGHIWADVECPKELL